MSKKSRTSCETLNKEVIADALTLAKAVQIVENMSAIPDGQDKKILGDASAIFAKEALEMRTKLKGYEPDASRLEAAAKAINSGFENRDLEAIKGTLAEIAKLSARKKVDVDFAVDQCKRNVGAKTR